MHTIEHVQPKEVWTPPTLTVHGPVEELTGQQDKKGGGSDGFTFNSNPIQNVEFSD